MRARNGKRTNNPEHNIMKKRIRKTGEIVDVTFRYISPIDGAYIVNLTDRNNTFMCVKGNDFNVDFEDVEEGIGSHYINWEQRRYEIAKTVLPYFRDGSNAWLSAEENARCAVHYADALIAELKKGKQEGGSNEK